jgi:uncharacterized membrane protein
MFKAKVTDVLEEVEKTSDSGEKIKQQNLKLLGLEGDFKNKELVFYGIGNIEIVGGKIYSVGDTVLVAATFNSLENSYNYYITDYVRSGGLLIILLVFVLSLIIVGHFKGMRSLISLILTFLVIIFFIVPKIMAGFNPVFIVIVGSIFILAIIIYLTEGFNLKAHLATGSIFISLLLVIIISWLFIELTKLTGVFSEDVFSLISIGQQSINFKGMLLAGMIVGSLGVLDDVVISQITSVEQLIETNPYQSWKEVYKKAYKIGISHISSMTNTLFLAYAGASLPILIFFVSPNSPFSSFEQIINNEAISTEIVRALSGSIGIILSVPISTFMAAYVLCLKKQKSN